MTFFAEEKKPLITPIEARIEYGVNPHQGLTLDTIIPIPCSDAPVQIFINGMPYCGFSSRAAAEHAIACWRGEVDGLNRPVVKQHGVHWPAIQGQVVTIKSRHAFDGINQ